MAAAAARTGTVAPVLDWQADSLARNLSGLWPGGVQVQVVAETGSTNSDLLERLRASGTTAGRQAVLLVTERQTAGRGRQGKAWQSAQAAADIGASLTFSLALPLAPQVQPAGLSGLSLAVGLALADALDAPTAAPVRIGLKWPNDLLLQDPAAPPGRKLGGILIETVASGPQRSVVIGIGLNIRPSPVPGLQRSADGSAQPLAWGRADLVECLSAPSARPCTAPGVLAQVAPALMQALLAFERHGFAPLVAAYARRDLLLGQRVASTLPAWSDALACGVDGLGRLLLRQGGREAAIDSGEVSLRPAARAAAETDAVRDSSQPPAAPLTR